MIDSKRVKASSILPPQLRLDEDLSWVLGNAFAAQPADHGPRNIERARDIARRLEISGRIGARLGRERCTLLAPAGADFFDDYLHNVAVETILLRAIELVTETAARLHCPVVLLKFAGLRLANVVAPGARFAQDVDVLVPAERARDLWSALQQNGFDRFGGRAYEHQLEPLVTRDEAVMEIHLLVPGVRGQSSVFARTHDVLPTASKLQASSVWVPSLVFLAAHAIAHGLLQNRASPQAYSPLRMISDLVDIRCRESSAIANAGSWLDSHVDDRELAAIDALTLALQEGRLHGRGFAESPPGVLLAHCIQARIDPAYASFLRQSALSHSLSERPRWLSVPQRVLEALLVSDQQLDALYGEVHGPWRRALRRLRRPFDLAARVALRKLRQR